jgi:nicotinamide-nucleotide amidase
VATFPPVEIHEEAHHALEAAGATVASAESLTGGQLAVLLTTVPGSSTTYVGGAVTYATQLKITLLGVSREIVDGVGVVSAECAEAMAVGARRMSGATYALSTTGVAGPESQDGKPVGTVYVGLAGPTGVISEELALDGSRAEIQAETCRRALALLVGVLRREDSPVG